MVSPLFGVHRIVTLLKIVDAQTIQEVLQVLDLVGQSGTLVHPTCLHDVSKAQQKS